MGPTDKLSLKYKVDIVLNASKKAVLPGLVNTQPIYQSLMKGSNDNESLKKWALNKLMPMLYVRNQRFIGPDQKQRYCDQGEKRSVS